ncbi:MAG: MFS transporter [Xanthobacteraceae bacterium]
MKSPNDFASRRVFHGWYVVYAIALVMTTTAGLAFYNLPVLLDAFVTERGFPVALASSATASFFIAAGVAGVLAGQLVDRFDARYVIIGSALLGTLALLSIGVLREAWQLFAFYMVFGFAYGGCGLVPTTTIVARWFETRRALALSIASTGLSLGGVFFTPLAALLILKLGLAGAAPWIALAFFLGVVPVTAWIVRASPQSMGLEPERAAPNETSGARRAAPSIPFSIVWRSRFFVATAAAFLFALGAQVGGIAHVYRLANTRVDVETATTAVAMLAITSLVGRLAVGWMLVKVSARAMTFALMIIQTVTLTFLAYAMGANSILVAAGLFGVTTGSMLMIQPLLLAEAFGVREYGRIYSVSQLVGVFGYALGPALAGILYEAADGYTIPYLAMAAGSLLGMVILMFSGPTRQTVA